MPTVWIPSLMRDLTGGQSRVDAPGRTVGEVIDALESSYPGIKDRLCAKGEISPGIAIHVDGRIAHLGLLEAVGERSEVHVLPAVGGG